MSGDAKMPPPIMVRSRFKGTPTMYIITNTTAINNRAVPRSGSFKIRIMGSPAKSRAPTTVSQACARSCRLDRKRAKTRMVAILANSDGCKLKGPRFSQRRDPATSCPAAKSRASSTTSTQ